MKIQDHIEKSEDLKLSLAPKLNTSKEWQARQQVVAEMRNEVDTFGLIKTGQEGINGNNIGPLMVEEIDFDETSEVRGTYY